MTRMAALVFVLGLKHGFDPDHAVPAPALSLATFGVILTACVLASRSAYREAGS